MNTIVISITNRYLDYGSPYICQNRYVNLAAITGTTIPRCCIFNSSPPGQNGRHFTDDICSDAFSWMKSFVFWSKFHWSLFLRVQLTTRTIRMPAFWDTPRCPMITHTSDSHQIPSQNKTNSKLQIYKNCQKFKFWNFAKNFTHDTPSEVVW